MKLSVVGAAALSLLPLCCCSLGDGDTAVTSKSGIESVYTDLSGAACKQESDKQDPDETPYLVCPGVAGYSLIVRRVDAGRKSIDIVDGAQRIRPLKYQEFVTRYMSTLGEKAEWRVATRDGRKVPIALIVRVQAREDNDNPARVTRTYFAVAKIAPNGACVTDRIPEGSRAEAAVRNAADSAQSRSCVPPQPRMPVDGTAIRRRGR